jgi:thioredoxin 1
MTETTRDVTDATFGTEVLTSSAPVLVDFWAKWCTPCRLIGPLVAESAKTYEGRLTVVKLDVNENLAVASRFKVRSIPTLMLFKDGAPVATHVGALSKGQLASFIEPHLSTAAAGSSRAGTGSGVVR